MFVFRRFALRGSCFRNFIYFYFICGTTCDHAIDHIICLFIFAIIPFLYIVPYLTGKLPSCSFWTSCQVRFDLYYLVSLFIILDILSVIWGWVATSGCILYLRLASTPDPIVALTFSISGSPCNIIFFYDSLQLQFSLQFPNLFPLTVFSFAILCNNIPSIPFFCNSLVVLGKLFPMWFLSTFLPFPQLCFAMPFPLQLPCDAMPISSRWMTALRCHFHLKQGGWLPCDTIPISSRMDDCILLLEGPYVEQLLWAIPISKLFFAYILFLLSMSSSSYCLGSELCPRVVSRLLMIGCWVSPQTSYARKASWAEGLLKEPFFHQLLSSAICYLLFAICYFYLLFIMLSLPSNLWSNNGQIKGTENVAPPDIFLGLLGKILTRIPIHLKNFGFIWLYQALSILIRINLYSLLPY